MHLLLRISQLLKQKHYFMVMCLYFCYLNQVPGQVQENSIPFSLTENLPAIPHYESLPTIHQSDCKYQSASSIKITKFACPIDTDLDPENSGQWTETPSGKIWRLGIRSANAYSLYINLHFLLQPGAKLFVYGPGYQNLRGAYSYRNNNTAEILTIAPIQGDRLIIELNLPSSQHSYGKIKITKVFHDFLNIFKKPAVQTRETWRVDGCDEDINCKNGRFWQTEKRSVCKIISNGGIGTGTLIGNTSGSSTPYVLTAYHLISSAEIAAEALFLFNYETSGCQESLTPNTGSLSGATLLSTTDHKLDFSLLKLHEKPPLSYQPYYAGWDSRNIIPQSGVCIHHPSGGSKQIAIEYHSVMSEDIGKGFDTNSTWKVPHWEVGTTEQGSSGAPLFNEQHRIVGTLTGGRSTCEYSKDDYFTKFGVAWDTYPSPFNQLKYWLDSAQTGQTAIDGYDPYGFNAGHCDTAWNYAAYDKLGLSNLDLTWGWISGHNSAGYTQYAERFESAGLLQINGIYLHVAKAYASNPLAHIELKVWEGAQYPEKECYSKLLFIKDFQPNKINYVAFDSVVKKAGPLFVGYKINYSSVSDTFALYHVQDKEYKRSTSMYIYDAGSWYSSKDPATFGMATSLGVGISECYGKSREPATSVLNVYPNPTLNFISLDIPDGAPVHDVKCTDSRGRPMSVSLEQSEDDNKLYFDFPPGLYYLRIITKEKSYAARIIVL